MNLHDLPAVMRALSMVLLAAAILWPVMVSAEVIEPNGVVVPLDSNNGETQLYTLFADRGENLDYIQDGSATPDVFSPLCGFTATFVLKQSGSALGVGWYNVDRQRVGPPADGEVFEILPVNSQVDTKVTGAEIRQDPNYLGGDIGFALLREPRYFTQAEYNPACTLCTRPGPWILSVAYPSQQADNAFYVAFEDGDANESTWNNDGDFNDYVFFFEGLSCSGAGEACEVEAALGECVPGVRECDGGGQLYCKPTVAPRAESCDGLDNDCDGSSDEGEDICPQGQVCSRGQCVPRCGPGEFACFTPPFTTCEDGMCVDPACAGKECQGGEACIDGECRNACTGVQCPGDQQCRAGVCVDPCMDVECPSGRVCQAGACMLHCDCAGCGAGEVCDAERGTCVDAGCAELNCAVGERCRAGSCVDACLDVVCPAGYACAAGQCAANAVPEDDSDAGMSDPGGPSGPAAGGDATDGPGQGATAGEDGSAGQSAADAGTGDNLLPRGNPQLESGCGCRLASQGPSRGVLGLASVLLFWLVGARVRRRALR